MLNTRNIANRRIKTTRPSERRRRANVERKIRSLFEEKNERLDFEVEFFQDNPPEKPSFPIVMLTFAFVKDIVDVLVNLTIILAVLTSVFSLCFSVVLFAWVYFRTGSGGSVQRKMIRWVWTRYIVTVLIEFVPFVNIIPTNTILILMVHNKETKLVQLIEQSLEYIHGAKITFK